MGHRTERHSRNSQSYVSIPLLGILFFLHVRLGIRRKSPKISRFNPVARDFVFSTPTSGGYRGDCTYFTLIYGSLTQKPAIPGGISFMATRPTRIPMKGARRQALLIAVLFIQLLRFRPLPVGAGQGSMATEPGCMPSPPARRHIKISAPLTNDDGRGRLA